MYQLDFLDDENDRVYDDLVQGPGTGRLEGNH
jgi:hypothetical protein